MKTMVIRSYAAMILIALLSSCASAPITKAEPSAKSQSYTKVITAKGAEVLVPSELVLNSQQSSSQKTESQAILGEEAFDDDVLISAEVVQEIGRDNQRRRQSINHAVESVAQEKVNDVLPQRRQRISGKQSQAPDSDGENITVSTVPVFPISVEFANVPLDVAVEMLSDVIGKNILLGGEVDGHLNLALNDVPWDIALETILSVADLVQYADERTNIIRWHEAKVLDKWLQAKSKRAAELQRHQIAARAIAQEYTELFRLFYANPEDVRDQLNDIFNKGGSSTAQEESNVGGIAGTIGRFTGSGSSSANKNSALGGAGNLEISANEKSRQLIVRGTQEQLDVIAELIEKIDIPTQQVMIEAFIVEVSDDFEKQLGSRLSVDGSIDGNRIAGTAAGVNDDAGLSLSNSSGRVFDLSATGASTSFGVLLNGDRLKLELSALEQEGFSKTISNPRLLAFDNEEASIFQGIQVPYSTVSNEGTQTEFKEAGLKLSVTPSIVGDGTLIMSVTVNQDTVEINRDNPPITKREITTRLLVRDRGTAILGGIYLEQESSSDRKVPVLGHIPLVGTLFSSKQSREDRRELLIFIVPTILSR